MRLGSGSQKLGCVDIIDVEEMKVILGSIAFVVPLKSFRCTSGSLCTALPPALT